MHQAKFLLFHVYAILGIASFWMNGNWIVWGFLVTVGSIVAGDLLLGDDVSEPKPVNKAFYNLLLWCAMPLLATLVVMAIITIEQSSSWLLWLTSALYVGLLTGTLGTVTAHELVHRKWGSFSHRVGRWLLAFSFDSNFAIEHVFGHHINIATEKDPASAPRGRNVYQHILVSSISGNISAWKLEKQRLQRAEHALLSHHNRFIRGVMMSVVFLLISWMLAGVNGLLFFTLSGLIAKSLLEIVNYMEHYGLVRVPGKRVYPRHSWNANNKISSWSLFNLTRHSHHHANANVPFQHLKPMSDAPFMPTGYLGTIGLTLIPPLWFKLMAPKLAHWDQYFADEGELQLLNKR
ncbi:alkane 1-monooxygenase [Planctobacterium marinum]|uniref:Alkane 1-monooxygenase n=1 Tax=Planctobacterium marinum TaxID=1631968 RepID=A0AA48HNP3_9ALTE|nr:alkane 1-monooxygenase [Planctobacterium marinum]